MVSHGRAVFERADVALVMDGGPVVDRGRGVDLREGSPIMRIPWEGEDAP
ncbi:MAG TPA: hypothetical protein VIY70_06135 [Acidimicrobiia bacterium]